MSFFQDALRHNGRLRGRLLFGVVALLIAAIGRSPGGRPSESHRGAVTRSGISALHQGKESQLLSPNEGETARGILSVRILEANTDRQTPVRVKLEDSSGRAAPLPEQAIAVMYGRNDRAEGYGYQPDSSFYVDGFFRVRLPPGQYSLTLSKGNEYLREQDSLQIEAHRSVSKTYRLERWINMPERGWYSADDHIHIRRSPRHDPLLLDWMKAEDIHVGNLLWMGDFWATYFAQYAFGKEGTYREGDYLITSGQEEPRTDEIGHALGLGASKSVRFRDAYYLYDKVFDRIRRHGGVAGYAHQAETFHGYRGMTLDGLRGKLDILELMQYCAEEGPLITKHYYHLLDLGYKITATAGSDFPWCGKGHRYGIDDAPNWPAQIGNVRFYTHVGGQFSYERWKNHLEAGHTFVTSGPIVQLRVNGKLPGETLDVSKGESITIRATAFGHPDQVPLRSLEIIGHGKALEETVSSAPKQSSSRLSIEKKLSVEHGLWIAAKTRAGGLQAAHTTPVYVTVNGGSFHNPDTAMNHLERSEKYLDEIEEVASERSDQLGHQAWRYEEGLMKRIRETRQVIDSLRTAFQ